LAFSPKGQRATTGKGRAANPALLKSAINSSGNFSIRANYYLDDWLVASVTSAPYGASLVGIPAGSYTFRTELVGPSGLIAYPDENFPIGVYVPPVPPSIFIRNTRTNGVTPSWSAQNCTLQQANSVTGTWNDVSGATGPYTVTTNTSQQFFRLRVGQ
jgi:hypothetical protein